MIWLDCKYLLHSSISEVSLNEVSNYINFRLKVVGSQVKLFSDRCPNKSGPSTYKPRFTTTGQWLRSLHSSLPIKPGLYSSLDESWGSGHDR
jgi:hypothetical protein